VYDRIRPERRREFFKFGLSECNAEHLRKACPRENFASNAEWASAIRNEVETVLLPRMRQDLPSPETALTLSADVLGEDLFKTEVSVEERLDAMIDRAVKRLVQAKAVKQMTVPTAVNGSDRSSKNGSRPEEKVASKHP
jgi:hypothetical protein